jgi:dihydrolipoamide dehydrogenase
MYLNILNHAADYGITVKDAKADFNGMVKRSRDVADGMSNGIKFLMKKNKIDVLTGNGILKANKTVTVTDEAGKSTDYTASIRL